MGKTAARLKDNAPRRSHTLEPARAPCASFSHKLANGSNWVAVTDGVVLTTAVDFHPKGQCNPPRPLATFFPMPSGYTSCDDISSEDKDELSVVGSELMKGTGDGNQADICILNQDGVWATEPVTFTDCGGFGCCRFEFVNQPPQEE